MPGAFDASAGLGHDPLPTAEEVQHSGQNVLRWLEAVATSEALPPVDVRLVQEIHFRWFETTFFIDGNTRATWHLRNYLLMLDGLRPLIDLADQIDYESAWWSATAEDHAELDAVVLNELALQEHSTK